jgi:hypothetical protein
MASRRTGARQGINSVVIPSLPSIFNKIIFVAYGFYV